jgi:hypothetical protein
LFSLSLALSTYIFSCSFDSIAFEPALNIVWKEIITCIDDAK